MCKCTPNIRTPFCGKPGCTWPEKESNTMTTLIPFDLEAAKAGAPVITRDGSSVRIVCWDRVGCATIMALVMNKLGDLESPCFYTRNGVCFAPTIPCSKQFDLFMAPKRIKKWRVVYRGDDDNAAQKDFDKLRDANDFCGYRSDTSAPYTVEIEG